MPDPHRHGYRGRRRPPWWPDDEPWPPVDGRGSEAWRHDGSQWAWRAGCFFLVALVVIALFAALAWEIGQALLGPGSPIGTIVVGILVVLVLAALVRAVLRATAPVGELIDAAGQVEAGDFSTRVSERGPREVRALARAFNSMSARLQAVDEERRSALADVSHELRTPLAVIQGNVEAMIDGVYPADRAHLEPLLEEIRHMERLIEDLRTLTLVEAGSLALHPEPTDLPALLRDVAAGFQSQAERAGVDLAVRAPDDLPAISLDPARIREVVANLLANALRHSSSGGHVDLIVEAAANEIAVTVRDTGSGIPADQLERIFDRFYRAPDSPGSGLGLPIAKSLVEAHGGAITATSAQELGTSIRFTLPRSG
jgi:two-component system sensor histidine kinase BaeS